MEHKHQNDHVIIVTSDAEDANVKQFRIKSWLLQTVIIVTCIIVGAVLGYIFYEQKIWAVANRKIEEQKAIVEEKEIQIGELETRLVDLQTEKDAEIQSLNDKINILSETVNQKTANEEALTKQIQEQFIPNDYPLTGSATMEEKTEGAPICIFTASEGITVVATASGTVTAINEDSEYGNSVWIDHGNGYFTIYRNQGKVNVKLGDTVAQGTTIYVITAGNQKFAYQMTKDGAYINPMDMMSISG